MHVISYGDFIQSIPYIFMGGIFGFVYHWSRNNIYVTIGVHFINNFLAFALYALAVLGVGII
jgi:membrane protease YdiL (CAAX protease family)